MFEAMIQKQNQLHHTHDCVYIPDIHSGNTHCVINEKEEYLKKDNLLSEFDTDQKRAIAIENLGIPEFLSGAMRFKGEIDILPIDNVEIGDVYLCNNTMHVAVYTETHFVRWHELDNNINWS